MIGRRRVEAKAHEAADGERIRGAPRDATFGVEAFEIADEQQAEVPARRQGWSSHHRRIESLTLLLGKPVEAGVVENAVQPRVERMARRDWQVGGRHPQRSLLARACAHRHGPHFTVRPSRGTSDFSPTLTTGC